MVGSAAVTSATERNSRRRAERVFSPCSLSAPSGSSSSAPLKNSSAHRSLNGWKMTMFEPSWV